MKKTLFAMLILSLTLALSVNGVLAGEYPKMKLRYANLVSAKLPTSKAEIYVAEELTKRTNGAVTVKLFHGSTLGGSTEMIDMVGEGAVDIGNFVASYVFSRVPMQGFFAMPLAYPDIESVTELTRLGWENSKKLQDDLKKNNLYPFNFRGLAVVHLISKKPIRTLEDLKGMKIRSFGAIYPRLFQKIGAIPVNLQFHEVYEGLQRGTIDAAITSYGAAFAYKNFEVAKYLSDISLGADSLYATYINLDLYNSWPQNLKDLFNEIVKEAEALSDKSLNGFDQYALAEMQKAGVELVHFEDQAKLDGMRDFAIDLTVETIVKQGKEYEQPARDYAKWLRAELAKRAK
jgi:TRAP-type C4-dicarboxylate transport system substrate-binding protein